MQPTLETERLILRPFALTDAKDVQRLAGAVEVAEHANSIPHPYEDGMAEKWIATHKSAYDAGSSAIFAITLKDTNELIGEISLRFIDDEAELGYWIGVGYWGRGYCTEAGQVVIAYALKVANLQRVRASHHIDNVASDRVMIKLGMVYDGVGKQYENQILYVISKANYDLSYMQA